MRKPFHPSYAKEPLDPDLVREHRIHKVVAGSAFAFAVCILPVVQYLLVGGAPPPGEHGQVAGVSTDQQILQSVAAEASPSPEPEDCAARRDRDLSDLRRFAEGKKAALLREYEQKVRPYQEAMHVLTGEDIEGQRQALARLIDDEYVPYLKQLQDVETVVAAEQQKISERTCE